MMFATGRRTVLLAFVCGASDLYAERVLRSFTNGVQAEAGAIG